MITYPSRRSVIKMLRMDVIVKAMKKRAISVHQVAELLNVKYACARSYIKELEMAGVVYIHKYERTPGDFRPLFKCGNKPNAPKPERIPHWVYDQARSPRPYRPRKGEAHDTKPRRDLAAAWF